MTVLQIIPAVAPCYGGPSTAVLEEARALERAGVHSPLATTDADGTARLPVATGEWLDHEGVRTIFFPRYGGEALKWSPAFANWLRRHAHDFDVVHIRGVLSHVCLSAAATCARAGVPYVLEPLGTLDRWSLDQKSLKKRALLSIAGRRTIAGAAAIRCTSVREAQEIANAFSVSTVATIPLGVTAPPMVASSTDHRNTPYVLSLSRLHPVKRLEQLIDAFEMAVQSSSGSPTWRLVIAGSGDADYVASLHSRAAQSSVASQITFTGWVSGSDRERLMAGASFLAVVSHHENFGLSLGEALASGVPALVCDGVHLAGEIAAAGAGWVAGEGTHDIAATLRTAFVETLTPATRDARQTAARTMSGRFAWPAIVGQLQSLYTRVSRQTPASISPSLGAHGSQPAGHV